MKKVSLLLSFVLSSAFVFGQSVLITPTNNEIVITKHSNTPEFIGRRTSGSSDAAPSATASGVDLAFFGGAGYNGSSYSSIRAYMSMRTTQPWNTTNNGTSLRFATTANNTTSASVRMTIDETGFVGIGTTSPARNLHVFNGSSGVTPTSLAPLFVENGTNAYLQLGSPEGSFTGVLFGKPSNNFSGGILYDGSSNLSLRTGGNNTRMTITS